MGNHIKKHLLAPQIPKAHLLSTCENPYFTTKSSTPYKMYMPTNNLSMPSQIKTIHPYQPKTPTLDCVLVQVGAQGQYALNFYV